MTNESYNGWTNYATWRVNLEIFDGYDPYENGQDYNVEAWDLKVSLKEYAEEILSYDANDQSLAYSYAMAFLADVNWYEIAEHMIKEYSSEELV